MKSRRTGRSAALNAGQTLSDPTATRTEKSAAASALTQRKRDIEITSARAASKASQVLRDPRATAAEKSAAASALSQRAKQ